MKRIISLISLIALASALFLTSACERHKKESLPKKPEHGHGQGH